LDLSGTEGAAVAPTRLMQPCQRDGEFYCHHGHL
jgi:hypothetical protein